MDTAVLGMPRVSQATDKRWTYVAAGLNGLKGFFMNLGKKVAGIMLAAISLVGTANASTVMCHECTPLEMKALAEQNLSNIAMNGPMYIVDLSSSTVTRFVFATDRTPDTDPEFDPINEWAEESPVEASVRQAILDASAVYQTLPAKGEFRIRDIDEHLPQSAYEALNDPRKNEALALWLDNTMTGQTNTLSAVLGLASNVPFFNINGIRMPAKVVFPDDSIQVYVFNPDTRHFEYKAGSSRDSRMNLIPDTKADVDGNGIRNYDLGDPNENEFYDLTHRILQMGVPVVDATQVVSGRSYYMVCANNLCTIYVVQNR